MKMNMKTWALAAGLGFAALSAQAQGVDYQEIGTSGDWTAITFDTEEKGKVCAIYSRPVDSQLLEGGEPRRWIARRARGVYHLGRWQG